MSFDQNRETIVSWVREAVGSKDVSITLEDTTNKAEGFLANLLFLSATMPDGEVIHLILKIGSSDLPFKRERYFFSTVIPTLKRFASEKNVPECMAMFPKCYKTFSTNKAEVVVLENLKSSGYEIHNRLLPMNTDHIRMIFKKLAEFHAVSFAMQDQQGEAFRDLTADYKHVFGDKFDIFKDVYHGRLQTVIKHLINRGRNDLVPKIEKLIEKGGHTILKEVLNDDVKEKVIVHGDAHNNNYMFRYKDEDRHQPTDIRIIDFQMSSLNSPVIDLSYNWYCVASKDDYGNVNKMIEFYHSELCLSLKKLGSDPDKIFPLSTLMAHWEKYSIYGVLMIVMYLDLLFVENEDLEKVGGNNIDQLGSITLKNEELYLQRLIPLIEYYN